MKKILFLSIFLGAPAFAQDYIENQLEWPTPLSESFFKIGGILHQYQNFPSVGEYYHEGVDFIGQPLQEVFTPVSGNIDAGYYSYVMLETGLSQKTYISIRDIDPADKEPKLWGKHYFEISITDKFGNRFEFHHIDRDHLPSEIVDAALKNETVDAGTLIGHIIEWPGTALGFSYDHLHYSIISPDGVQMNPFWFSKKIEDTTPPSVSSIYFELEDSCPKTGFVDHFSVTKLSPEDKPTYIVIQTKDYLDSNRFPHAPTKIFTDFSNGETHLIDFTYSLRNAPPIRDLYVERICYGSPSQAFILNASSNFNFYVKIPIPENFSGSASITISDYAGNETNTLVNIKN